VPPGARRTDPEGTDDGWVVQTMFVLILLAVRPWHISVPRGAESFREGTADSMTIVAGVPVVAVLSVVANLPMWGDQAVFAVRVDAPV
jgi:hypothetical protein